MRTLLGLLMVTSLATAPAFAAPTVATLGDFAGATVIDSDVAHGTAITNQFAAQGITFSGGLYGYFNLGPELLPSATRPYTTNVEPVLCEEPCPVGNAITITFSSERTSFGFFAATNPDDDLVLTLFDGATNLGSLTYTTDLTETFIGIAESDGFDRVLIEAVGTGRQTFAADGFRFKGLVTPVPEPATFGLFGLGILGFAVLRRQGNPRSRIAAEGRR
jgi:PEP-CTERM motif